MDYSPTILPWNSPDSLSTYPGQTLILAWINLPIASIFQMGESILLDFLQYGMIFFCLTN